MDGINVSLLAVTFYHGLSMLLLAEIGKAKTRSLINEIINIISYNYMGISNYHNIKSVISFFKKAITSSHEGC